MIAAINMNGLTDEHKRQIQSVVDQTVARFINDLPGQLHHLLTKQVAQILGLRNDFKRWEADPFNKESTLMVFVNQRVKDLVAKEVEKQTWKPNQQQLDAIADCFNSNFKYELESHLRKLAAKRAEEVSKKLEKELSVDILMEPVKMANVANPNFMNDLPQTRDAILKCLTEGQQVPK